MENIVQKAIRYCVAWIGFGFSVGTAQPAHTPQVGIASYYGWREHGLTMANGHRFHALGLTAASRSLAFGSWVRVTNLENNRSVIVQITDRGPYVGGRVIDLSLGAARRLGMVHQGLQRVVVERTEVPKPSR
jgi:rare lipoprotein A